MCRVTYAAIRWLYLLDRGMRGQLAAWLGGGGGGGVRGARMAGLNVVHLHRSCEWRLCAPFSSCVA